MNNLFTINPGTSFRHVTGTLFTDFTKLIVRFVISSDVSCPGITSTNFISCGGLKKCIPINFFGLEIVFAISVMGNVLVLDAKITCSPAALSNSAYTFFLRSIISGTASITRSQS